MGGPQTTQPGVPLTQSDCYNVRALVIGGAGYVGKRLVEMLVARRGYVSIVILDNNTTSANTSEMTTLHDNEKILRSTLPKIEDCSWCTEVSTSGAPTLSVEYISGSITVFSDVMKACEALKKDTPHGRFDSNKDITRVFHLASPDPIKSTQEVLNEIIVEGTKNVLKACHMVGIDQLVFCSSCSVAFTGKPIRDSSERSPTTFDGLDPYCTSKLLAEMEVRRNETSLSRAHTTLKTLRTICLRPHMIFGPGDKACIGGMLAVMKRGKSSFMIGDGSALVDPTYVDNVCWGHILAGEALNVNPSLDGQVFNLTNDESIRFWDFFSTLCGEFGYDRPKYKMPYSVMLLISRLSGFLLGSATTFTPRTIQLAGLDHTYSCELAKSILGYSPLVSLREGLKLVIAYTKAKDKDVATKVEIGEIARKNHRKVFGNGGDAVNSDVRKNLVSWSFYYLTLAVAYGYMFKTMAVLFQSFSHLSTRNDSTLIPLGNQNYASVFHALIMALGAGAVNLFFKIYSSRSTVLGSNTKIPLVGDLVALKHGPTVLCSKLAKQHFDCFHLTIFGKPIVFMTGRDGYEFFFKATDDEISLGEVYKVSKGLFGPKVLYDADLESRQQQFHHLSLGLSEKNLKQYVPLIVKECEEYFSSWGPSGRCADICVTLARLITLTATRCLLGREVREVIFEDCERLLRDLDHGVTPLAMIFPFFPTKKHQTRDKARLELTEKFSAIIAQRRAKPDSTDSHQENDMLRILMDATYKDGRPFSDEEICGCLIALMFGGQHTSSVTSAWMVINLMGRASKQTVDGVMEEQRLLMEQGNITYENITKKTETLGAVLTESLRLSNPLALVLRYLTKSRYFKGHKFPKGTILGVCPNEAGLSASIYSEPTKFIPERWLQNDWNEWRNDYKFVGFGAGRHTCMGRRFAHLQIKIILSYMLQNFLWTRTTDVLPQRDDKAMVIGPDRAYPLDYRRINGKIDEAKKSWKYSPDL